MRRKELDMYRKFRQGDIVTDGEFILKVVEPIQDEDGTWWYECEALEFKAPFNREIPQAKLSEVEEINIAINVSHAIQTEYVKKYGFAGSEKFHEQMMKEIHEAVANAIGR